MDSPSTVRIGYTQGSCIRVAGYHEMASRVGAQVQLPHNLHAILREGDSQIDASCDNLIEQLHGGIFLNQNKLKFRVDRLLWANAFDINARGLPIVWGSDKRYWNWTYMQDKDHHAQVEVAELLDVCWLEMKKKFSAKYLTPGIVYKVSLVLMMKNGGYGFANHPVELTLDIPNYNERIVCKEDFSKLPKNKWTEIRIGEFVTSCNMTGDIQIWMFEDGSQLKRGLVVHKIVFHPVRRQN